MTRLAAIASLFAVLAGCFPYVTTYLHLEAPGATNMGACAGAPVFARYEAGGATFRVTLEPGAIASRTSAGYVQVRAPEKMTVTVPDPAAYLTPEGQAPVRFELEPVGIGDLPMVREQWRRQGVAEHRFEFNGLPSIPSPGTLRLPDVYLDGVAVRLPPFRYERRPYAGVVPLNC